VIAASASARREHQQQVEALLAEIRRRTDELRRRSVYGVRPPALAAEKRELKHLRRRLTDQVEPLVRPA